MATPAMLNAGWMALCLPEARRYRRAIQHVPETQEAVLQSIISRNAVSSFGAKHDFNRLRSASEFRRAVPLSTYDDLRNSIERIAAGERGVLTAEPVELLEPTGGSTTGEKLIPYNRSLRRAFQRAVRAWVYDLFSSRAAVRRGTAYWSISPLAHAGRRTPGGVPIGFADDVAYLGAVEKRLIRRTLAVPPEAALGASIDGCQYATLFFLLRDPSLSLVSVWSPTFFTQLLRALWRWRDALCDDVECGWISPPHGSGCDHAARRQYEPRRERAAQLRQLLTAANDIGQCVMEIWPQLALISCWADGPSARYARELAELLPSVEIQPKGLLATEAVVSFPLTSAAACVLAVRSHFFEFLPAESASGDGATFLAHELEVGRDYLVVVTTQGGLYRYKLHDQVKVVGRDSGAPLLTFVGKSDDVSDLVGEKLSAALIEAALTEALADFSERIRWTQLAVERNPPRYVLLVSTAGNDQVAPLAQLCERLERALLRNPAFRYARSLGQLPPIEPRRVTSDEIQRAVARTVTGRIQAGQRPGDVKPPTVLDLTLVGDLLERR